MLRSVINWALLFAAGIAVAAYLHSPFAFFRQWSWWRGETLDPSLMEETSCPGPNLSQFDTTHRTVFEYGKGTVRGFPSTGGILMLPLDTAVASYLNIPRLSAVERAASDEEEDAFCDRLRLLGAMWWWSEYDYMQKLLGFELSSEEEKTELIVGWPNAGGGVWVWRASTPRERPKEYNMLNLCVDMDERCELLERWGATFYQDPAEVPEFACVLGPAAASVISEENLA